MCIPDLDNYGNIFFDHFMEELQKSEKHFCSLTLELYPL